MLLFLPCFSFQGGSGSAERFQDVCQETASVTKGCYLRVRWDHQYLAALKDQWLSGTPNQHLMISYATTAVVEMCVQMGFYLCVCVWVIGCCVNVKRGHITATELSLNWFKNVQICGPACDSVFGSWWFPSSAAPVPLFPCRSSVWCLQPGPSHFFVNKADVWCLEDLLAARLWYI